MGKNKNPSLEWDDDDYSSRKQKIKRKKESPGIESRFDINPWEVQKEKTNNRRKNKQRYKDKYDKKYDDWN